MTATKGNLIFYLHAIIHYQEACKHDNIIVVRDISKTSAIVRAPDLWQRKKDPFVYNFTHTETFEILKLLNWIISSHSLYNLTFQITSTPHHLVVIIEYIPYTCVRGVSVKFMDTPYILKNRCTAF